MAKFYEFTVTVGATGTDPREAWEQAVQSFFDDPGDMPSFIVWDVLESVDGKLHIYEDMA